MLEPAARHPHARTGILETADECRKALLPRMTTPASVEAAVARKEREVLIPRDAIWRYFPGTSEPSDGTVWTGREFDDTAWKEGKSGFGYGDGDDATELRDMQGGYMTLYIRRKLSLPDPGRYERIVISLDVDDGAVVHVNGREVGRARAGAPGTRLPHDAAASSTTPEAEHSEFPLESSFFTPGENAIAIQGLNVKGSSDFSLIPSIHGELPRSPSDRARLLEAAKAGADTEPGRGLLALLESILLLEAGKHAEARLKLELAAKAFPVDPVPHLRLAGCLRAAGDAKAAEAALRRAIEGGLDDREVWDLWAAVSLSDLGRPAADVLGAIPQAPGAAAEAGGKDGRAADLRWLLEALAGGGSIRINCGGEDHIAKDGRAWSRDRFYLSGVLPGEPGGNPYSFTLAVEKTEDDVLYQSHRWFPADGIQPSGYRFPLPPGEYRVTLHFAEFGVRKPGSRTFGVLLEGREVLPDHEPLKAGFGTAEAKSLPPVGVEDGLLDLRFLHGSDNPMVSAIEIEPASRGP